MNRYKQASLTYGAIGVDTEAAIKRLKAIPISLHCWQGDDVMGFVSDKSLSGGIQATGNYMGRAKNFEELKKDLDVAFSLIPGKKRLNLHAIYAVSDKPVEMDKLTIAEFKPWLDWALPKGICIDFNPTLFSNPMVKDGLTLSSPNKETRDYWISHVKSCRAIAAEIGRIQGAPCLNNIWIADGLKDVPADRLTPRLRLNESLDRIFEVEYPKEYLLDSLESKVFGIGLESYTVGSSEFYLNYSMKKGICCLLDNGHYHPNEYVSDKIPSLLVFFDKVALHVTRGVRWDSDHVVILDDELKEIAKEIIRNDADKRVLIGLDYFDASINRISAWVTGDRNMQKALLFALLMPHDKLKEYQDKGDFTSLMCLLEELKIYPFGDIWNQYLEECGVEKDYYSVIKKYETEVLSKR